MSDLDGIDIMDSWDPMVLVYHSKENNQPLNVMELGCIDDLPEWKL